MGLEDLQHNFLTGRLEDLVKWARTYSMWPATFGLACCAIEMMSVGAADFDLARFGMEVFRASPRQADLMIVAGRVSQKMAPVLRQVYDQMMEPKWVLSMGVCASTGGMFNNYAIVQGVDQIVPVDVYAPGCPPTPETLMHAILTLHEKVRTDHDHPPTPPDAARGGSWKATRVPTPTTPRPAPPSTPPGGPPTGPMPCAWARPPQPGHRPQRGRAAVTVVADASTPQPDGSGQLQWRSAGPAAPSAGGAGDRATSWPSRRGSSTATWSPTYREGGFETCADLCAVDYLTHPGRRLPDGVGPERFEVVVNLLSLSAGPPGPGPGAGSRVGRRGAIALRPSTRVSRPWSARPSTCSASSSRTIPT